MIYKDGRVYFAQFMYHAQVIVNGTWIINRSGARKFPS
jgi:hypothetical protein